MTTGLHPSETGSLRIATIYTPTMAVGSTSEAGDSVADHLDAPTSRFQKRDRGVKFVWLRREF